MESPHKPIPPENITEREDDLEDELDEPLGQRQPGADNAIVCEGGCE